EDQKDRAFFCYLAFTLPHTEIIASDAVLNTPEFHPSNWPETYTANTSAHISQSQPHRHFGAELRMIDNSIGAIIAKLEDPNGDGNTSDSITANTLLIFTSDNGGQLQSVWGNAPSNYFNANGILRGGKQDSYEGGLRVPMVAKWPGKISPGTVSNLPTYFADFLPTVCDLVSIAPPKYTDGLSIVPTLTGETAKQKKHPYLFWSHQAGRLDHAVRAGKWKAVKRGSNAIELFDLDADPSESNNVAASNPTIVAEMQKIITREYKPDLTDPRPSTNSPTYPNHP
ncbi:MAG: sulfatase-like hydrolase/transferase, partial [Akkermansiaceae bacterium]